MPSSSSNLIFNPAIQKFYPAIAQLPELLLPFCERVCFGFAGDFFTIISF
jgi:hypothetical protein